MTTAVSTAVRPLPDRPLADPAEGRASARPTGSRTGTRPAVVRPTPEIARTGGAPTTRGASDAAAPRLHPVRTSPYRRSHLSAVPDCEPPFDDERPGFGPVTSAAVRWSWSRSIGVPVVDWSVPSWCNDADMGVERTARSALPDPRETAGVLARALIEALAGLRQLNQLSAHCSPEVYAALRQRVRAGGAPPKLMSVRASEPTDGIAEASAVFRRGSRAAALAFRLQGIDGRWRVTALQIG